MPVFNQQALWKSLQEDLSSILAQADQLPGVPTDLLVQRPHPEAWSPAQILEHLNFYNRAYLPKIEAALGRSFSVGSDARFRSGWLGNYFTKLMQPKAGNIANKMKAPVPSRPSADLDPDAVIREFIAGQQQLLKLLNASVQADWNRPRIATTLSPLIRLKLGDTLRFLIAHQTRHMLQLQRTLKSLQLVNK